MARFLQVHGLDISVRQLTSGGGASSSFTAGGASCTFTAGGASSLFTFTRQRGH